MKLVVMSRNEEKTNKNVYIAYHPSDIGLVELAVKDILKADNCTIYYYEYDSNVIEEEEIQAIKKRIHEETHIFVPIITKNFLYNENLGFDYENNIAEILKLPILPFVVDKDLLPIYLQRIGQRPIIDVHQEDYWDEIKNYFDKYNKIYQIALNHLSDVTDINDYPLPFEKEELTNWGLAHLFGIGTNYSYNAALNYFESAERDDDLISAKILQAIYSSGIWCPKDFSLAYKYGTSIIYKTRVLLKMALQTENTDYIYFFGSEGANASYNLYNLSKSLEDAQLSLDAFKEFVFELHQNNFTTAVFNPGVYYLEQGLIYKKSNKIEGMLNMFENAEAYLKTLSEKEGSLEAKLFYIRLLNEFNFIWRHNYEATRDENHLNQAIINKLKSIDVLLEINQNYQIYYNKTLHQLELLFNEITDLSSQHSEITDLSSQHSEIAENVYKSIVMRTSSLFSLQSTSEVGIRLAVFVERQATFNKATPDIDMLKNAYQLLDECIKKDRIESDYLNNIKNQMQHEINRWSK